jgi:hypothetical protein
MKSKKSTICGSDDNKIDLCGTSNYLKSNKIGSFITFIFFPEVVEAVIVTFITTYVMAQGFPECI